MNTVVEARDYFDKVAEALKAIDAHELWRASEVIRGVKERNGIVWIVGNGGSAATASHFANDLIKMCHVRAIPLADLTPTVTAYGNDEGWDMMFANPMGLLVSLHEVLVAISCSGSSVNVLRAASRMHKEDLIVLTGLVGWTNGLDKYPCAAKIRVPSADIRVVEDAHLSVCHAIAGMLAEGEG